MRYYGRRRPRYRAHSSGSHWLTFSDLMSALVLIFILVMFYAIYQYTDTTFTLLSQQAVLDEATAALSSRETELEEKDRQLAQASLELTDSQLRLSEQQKIMLVTQGQLEHAQKVLDEQQEELSKALTQLTDQQALLDAQRTQLEGQQAQLTDQQRQMAEQQTQLEALVGVRARIVASLTQAFASADVGVKVDDTGALRIQESVMFDFGSSVLKDSGKAILDRLVPAYVNVIFGEENEGYVNEILIEGHTDNVGSYSSNLRLSVDRAQAVMNYISSPENTSISAAMKAQLEEKALVTGRAYTDPVYDDYGNYDADASRRVEFKFRMQDAEAIESVRLLLESMSAPSDPAVEGVPPEGTPADEVQPSGP